MTITDGAIDISTVKNLAQAIKDLQETVEPQADRIDDLEGEVT